METPALESTEERGPRVSILIVSQHQVQLLRPTLTALAARLEPGLSEVLVVDCGSRDGSARLDEEFEGVTFLRLPRNFGWTKAINIATRTAKGEFLFLLPNGCQVEPDTIQRLLEALEANPKAGAVSPAGEFYALPKPGDTALTSVPASAAEYPFDHPVLLPKVTLASMNYLPDAYGQYYGDLELFYKIREAGKKVLVLEDLVVKRDRAPQEMIDAELDAADRLNGLGAFYSKNYGFMPWLSFWLGQTASAAFSFKLGLAAKLLGSSKVDGL
jgi:glycosyltransferase involved in cell wall biosynthesis